MGRKTVLDRIKADRIRQAKRTRRDEEREAAFQDQIAMAIDRAQDDRLAVELGSIFREHGHGTVAEPQSFADERARVEAIIARDRADTARDAARELAQIEVRDGVFVNLDNAVDEPTPEWLAKGDARPYTPRQPDGTVRQVRTMRRVMVHVTDRMFIAGKLSEEHRDVCAWYRSRHEAAGLEGRYKTSHISLTGNTGGGGGMGQAPVAMHAFEAQAREEFRAARNALTPFYVRFFDAVVLHDVPVRRAARFARCHFSKVAIRLRSCCEEILAWTEANRVNLGGRDHAS